MLIGEKGAEPRSGSVIHKKVATFGPQSPHVRTEYATIFDRPLGENLRRNNVRHGNVGRDNNTSRRWGDWLCLAWCTLIFLYKNFIRLVPRDSKRGHHTKFHNSGGGDR
jgi:hypothetical protein